MPMVDFQEGEQSGHRGNIGRESDAGHRPRPIEPRMSPFAVALVMAPVSVADEPEDEGAAGHPADSPSPRRRDPFIERVILKGAGQ